MKENIFVVANRESFFRKRFFETVNKNISRIKEAEKTETTLMDSVSEKERQAIFAFERELNEKINNIDSDSLKVRNFYPILLKEFARLSPQAQKALKFVTGLGESELLTRTNFDYLDLIEQKGEWSKKEREFGMFSSEAFQILEGEVENLLFESLRQSGDFHNEFAVSLSERLRVVENDEEAINREKKLREFKQFLKKSFYSLGNSDFDQLKKLILIIYSRKTNEFLVNKQANAMEIIAMEDDLKNKNARNGTKAKKMSVYDKFLTGSSSEKNVKGDYQQVGSLLLGFVNQVEEEYLQNELSENERVRNMGLDLEKIKTVKIAPSEAQRLVEKVLSDLGLTESKEPWKAKIYKGRKSAMVSNLKKEVMLGDVPVSVINLVATLLGHEIVHVCQYENKKNLSNLKILENVGLDRRSVLMEAGAMQYENEIKQKVFGFKKVPGPFYIRAMEKKQAGGDYLDCVEAFYNSMLKILMAKKNEGLINDVMFEREKEDALKLAINRVKRLFRQNFSLNEKGEYLTMSISTNYLEQEIISGKLKENGLEKYLYIGGINLDILPDLIKAGFIKNDSEVKMPGDYPIKIWENELKSRYLEE